MCQKLEQTVCPQKAPRLCEEEVDHKSCESEKAPFPLRYQYIFAFGRQKSLFQQVCDLCSLNAQQ